jgi:LysR family glycine cleavage system transcriptional activator
MLMDAAIDSQGIALARTMLAASDLLGRLVRPFRAAIPLRNTYWIVCPKATRLLPKIVVFRDWLLEEVAADRRRLKATSTTTVGA